MKDKSIRQRRINELIQQQLSELLIRESWLPEFVTVMRVEVSPDLRHAHVCVVTQEEKKSTKALAELNKHAYKIQGELNRKLSLKPLPRLHFHIDEDEYEGQRIEALLDEVGRGK